MTDAFQCGEVRDPSRVVMSRMVAALTLLIGGVTVFLVWKAIQPRWDFRIVVHGDSVEFVKGVPAFRRAAFEAFFLHDLQTRDRIRISGRRESSGRLKLRIEGASCEGEKQQIRNFLLMFG